MSHNLMREMLWSRPRTTIEMFTIKKHIQNLPEFQNKDIKSHINFENNMLSFVQDYIYSVHRQCQLYYGEQRGQKWVYVQTSNPEQNNCPVFLVFCLYNFSGIYNEFLKSENGMWKNLKNWIKLIIQHFQYIYFWWKKGKKLFFFTFLDRFPSISFKLFTNLKIWVFQMKELKKLYRTDYFSLKKKL